ncbi:hypothetical protein SSYRP_v1c01190 [Spiroplasma syrphidicola EA-1]|uniref:Uncharacterized protein n=1 Tax=Spiroplasma syrphidicola EA-1 TaxID=1276229 RepID=R4UHV8_9MOLU|nr:hypothetical protein [Spiroplasma syrphidicola]AGM25715.1 hypothetical protein SSYRP_v1c01190 [Spiroplasma syrphidicola EA-1]
MHWNPDQTIEILKEHVYSKDKLDEYRNRVALSNIELPSFYTRENPEQSFSSIVVRLINRKELKKFYSQPEDAWIFESIDEIITKALQESDKLVGFKRHQDIYLALYSDQGQLDYLIDIISYINTTIKIINYSLYEKYNAAKEIKIAIGAANDPSLEMISELEEEFLVPFDQTTKTDCVLLAENYAAEVVMFNNLAFCTDAWLFKNISFEKQEQIRKNARQYFSIKMPRQKLFSDLIDLEIKEKIEKGTLTF